MSKSIILGLMYIVAICWIVIIYQMWKAPNEDEK